MEGLVAPEADRARGVLGEGEVPDDVVGDGDRLAPEGGQADVGVGGDHDGGSLPDRRQHVPQAKALVGIQTRSGFMTQPNERNDGAGD